MRRCRSLLVRCFTRLVPRPDVNSSNPRPIHRQITSRSGTPAAGHVTDRSGTGAFRGTGRVHKNLLPVNVIWICVKTPMSGWIQREGALGRAPQLPPSVLGKNLVFKSKVEVWVLKGCLLDQILDSVRRFSKKRPLLFPCAPIARLMTQIGLIPCH